MSSRFVVLLLSLALATGALGTSAPASASQEVYEVHHVRTVDGAVVRLEVWRDASYDAEKQPVILTYSPYNSLSEPETARDSLGEKLVPEGYARAVADVLGTRGSTGCWDYGGPKEQQSGVDVVKYLARLPWSNGRVAMTGGSYNGTTATMVAARGKAVPELKAIVPIAAISRWYGYAYGNGVRYFLNSEKPTDEGFDTPLAFDAGFAKTVAADPMGEHFADTVRSRAAECGAVEHNQEAYDRNPDYDGFWLRRDYRKDARRVRAAVLLAHGWRDYNVKQEEATELFRRLRVDRPRTRRVEGVPFKLMYLTQGSHSGGTDGAQWERLLERFLAHTLKGERNGIRKEGPVITQGGSSNGPTRFRTARDYPLPATSPTRLWLRGAGVGTSGHLAVRPERRPRVASYVEAGGSTEELPLGSGLTYLSRPLARPTRVVGSAVLDAWVRVSNQTMHLTPVLVDVAPDGSRRTISRGFQHVDYRNGLREADPVTDRWLRVHARLLPQDYTLARGHRIGLWVQSSNTVWAVPGNPGEVDVAQGRVGPRVTGSRLLLPTIGRRATWQ
ncbi:MAG TPA: CocE/NonD family hydrolase [Nocardioidaceae bacterium]|nr:CocE/NonD family hydrolase [Nocardioidaceae bacterium]